MLTGIRIDTYRGLKRVDVPLKPLTVLIGPNDSGKTSFLRAVNVSLHREAPQTPDTWRGSGERVFVMARHAKGQYGTDTPQPPPFTVALFRLPSVQGLAMESQGYPDHSGPPWLSDAAPEVPALIDYLLRHDRTRFFGFVEAAKKLIPGLEDIVVATPNPDRRRIDLVLEKGFQATGDYVSSGVRLLLFYLSLAYHPRPANIWLLEEPENGVHPKRLQDIVTLLREVTQGVHAGQASQVILTTHSPYLLDLVDLDRDQVLVFRRNDDGSRSAEPADRGRLKTFTDEFMLGEIWFNVGESGLVAKPQ